MIAVLSDFHFPSDKNRQQRLEAAFERLKAYNSGNNFESKNLSSDINNTALSAIFVCGDFTDNRCDTKIGESMKLPSYIHGAAPVFFIDGNHEDYTVLESLPEIRLDNVSGSKAKIAGENIYYLQRGSCCIADNMKILAIGASTSGPGYKKNHPDIWQPQEDLSETDKNNISAVIREHNAQFDIVLTHTLPELRMKQWFPDKDISRTNSILDDVFKEIEYRQWFFGHFHIDRDFSGDFHCLYNDIALVGKDKAGLMKVERIAF